MGSIHDRDDQHRRIQLDVDEDDIAILESYRKAGPLGQSIIRRFLRDHRAGIVPADAEPQLILDWYQAEARAGLDETEQAVLW